MMPELSQAVIQAYDAMAILSIGLFAYLTIATVVFGCPYCLMPDLAWPKTLYRMVRE